MLSPSTADLKSAAHTLSRLSLSRPVQIMEVCGTHTTEYFRSGIRECFPPRLRLVDGPGCPVCVTPNSYLDRAIRIGREYGVTIATFGDLMRVPSSDSSLAREKSEGRDVRVVYSPFDALQIARADRGRQVMFLSVGFETTIPLEAAAVLRAREMGLSNFSLLVGNKLTPPAVNALLQSRETRIDGFILPGHVCTIIGLDPWRFIGDRHGKPAVIAGFRRHHILAATLQLVTLIRENRTGIINAYPEAVPENGNPRARETMNRVFAVAGDRWRGIGSIPRSGLRLRKKYEGFDAQKRFPVTVPPGRENPDCRCGEVLTGRITPVDCTLFGRACTPLRPVGACMVSSEGSCAAYYKYHR